MSLLKCPKCGEEYSDSYDTCPFCAEDEEFLHGTAQKAPTRRIEKYKSPSIWGPALVVVLVLLLVVFLLYTFLGGRIADKLHHDDTPDTEQVDPEQTQDDAATPDPLTLDQETMTLTVGEKKKIAAAGPKDITWTSSDEKVATVASDGTVTAVKAGEATVTAVTGEESAACTVTVKEKEKPAEKPKQNKDLAIATMYGALGKNERGRWEFSAAAGETLTVKVTGTNSDVTWSSSDKSVAKVTKSGKFRAVGSGQATLIAEVDGQELKCDVIVN